VHAGAELRSRQGEAALDVLLALLLLRREVLLGRGFGLDGGFVRERRVLVSVRAWSAFRHQSLPRHPSVRFAARPRRTEAVDGVWRDFDRLLREPLIAGGGAVPARVKGVVVLLDDLPTL